MEKGNLYPQLLKIANVSFALKFTKMTILDPNRLVCFTFKKKKQASTVTSAHAIIPVLGVLAYVGMKRVIFSAVFFFSFRALDDIKESIKELKYYRDTIFKSSEQPSTIPCQKYIAEDMSC